MEPTSDLVLYIVHHNLKYDCRQHLDEILANEAEIFLSKEEAIEHLLKIYAPKEDVSLYHYHRSGRSSTTDQLLFQNFYGEEDEPFLEQIKQEFPLYLEKFQQKHDAWKPTIYE